MNLRVNIFIVVLLQIIIMIHAEGKKFVIKPFGQDHCLGINSTVESTSEKLQLQVKFRVYNSTDARLQTLNYRIKQLPLDRHNFIYTAGALKSTVNYSHVVKADKNKLPYFCFFIETEKGFKGKNQEIKFEVILKN